MSDFDSLLACDLSTHVVKVTRFTKGRLVGGKLKTSKNRPFAMPASVQPLNGRDKEMLPEGRRQSHTYKLYTKEQLYVSDDRAGQKADHVEIDGEMFEVFMSEKERGLDLDHYKSFAARLNK
jgi:hypothetical protein